MFVDLGELDDLRKADVVTIKVYIIYSAYVLYPEIKHILLGHYRVCNMTSSY